MRAQVFVSVASFSCAQAEDGRCACKVIFPAKNTMQLLMWQLESVGAAHYVVDRFEVLCALDDASVAMRRPHLHQPWRLDRCNRFIHSPRA